MIGNDFSRLDNAALACQTLVNLSRDYVDRLPDDTLKTSVRSAVCASVLNILGQTIGAGAEIRQLRISYSMTLAGATFLANIVYALTAPLFYRFATHRNISKGMEFIRRAGTVISVCWIVPSFFSNHPAVLITRIFLNLFFFNLELVSHQLFDLKNMGSLMMIGFI